MLLTNCSLNFMISKHLLDNINIIAVLKFTVLIETKKHCYLVDAKLRMDKGTHFFIKIAMV